jgi:hypothetical protein
MPRAPRPRPDRVATRWLSALAGLCLLLASCSQGPLASIDTEPTPLPPFEGARLAFVDTVKAGDLSYHAVLDGRVYGAGNDIPLVGSLDVAGADYQYVATYTLTIPKDTKPTFAIRYVDGTAWERIDKGKWQENIAFKPDDTNSPFAFITRATDVRFSKTETVDGRPLHHVTFIGSKLIGLNQIQAANLTNEDFKRSTFDLLLDDEGSPVSGSIRIEGVGRVSQQLQEIVVDVDLIFSKVGADIAIKAP